jgi:hypothetical protein
LARRDTWMVRMQAARRRVALIVHALLAAALVPAFAFWAHPRFPHIGLLVLVLLVAVLAEPAEVELRNGIRIDATTAAGLIALVLAGPLAALLVMFLPLVISSTITWRIPALRVERRELFRVGNLSNLASYGWSLLLAGALLGALGVHGPSLAPLAGIKIALCGVVASASQLALGPGIHRTLWKGYSLGEVGRDALQAAPSDLTVLALGSVAAVLIAPWHLGALLLFTVIVLVPATVPAGARARPANRLAQHAATARYADPLGTVLGLGREERRHIPIVASLARANAASDLESSVLAHPVLGHAALEDLKLSIEPVDRPAYASWVVSEWFDGSGPAGIAGEQIPLLARVIAFAARWSFLTAAGGPELSHEQALVDLRAEAGRRFDPAVLDAAEFIVARERRTTELPAFLPFLHRVPRLVRRPALALGVQLKGRPALAPNA